MMRVLDCIVSEHLAFLRRKWCDEVQGYLLGRPAPLAGIRHLVLDSVGSPTFAPAVAGGEFSLPAPYKRT